MISITDGEIDASFLSKVLGRQVERGRVRPLEKMGGLSGDFELVDVTFADNASTELVLKRTGKGKEAHAVALGTTREAKFYALFDLDIIPRAYHTYANGGDKEILMERLRGVPAGVFFGKGNPNNWGVELIQGPSAVDISEEAFRLYAKLHSKYWRDPSVLDYDWLRGADWLKGEGRGAWVEAQMLAADAWKGIDTTHWDRHLVECVNASLAKIDWDDFQAELKARPWTVVHGDAHPHNILRVDGRLVLIDFEMVGLGSNAQELGQFLISHMVPDERRQHEERLVRVYYGALGLQETYSFEACWREYLDGGAGRWLWFVPYLASVCPPAMAQYFHDQLAAFLHDHFPVAADVPMPRV